VLNHSKTRSKNREVAVQLSYKLASDWPKIRNSKTYI